MHKKSVWHMQKVYIDLLRRNRMDVIRHLWSSIGNNSKNMSGKRIASGYEWLLSMFGEVSGCFSASTLHSLWAIIFFFLFSNRIYYLVLQS